jgi:1,6-anhydro-N-acetylmuramate kinase
MKVGCW